MKYAGKIVFAALLLALLTGCASKKVKPKPPSTAQAPTTTDQTGAMYPPPFPEKTVTPPPPAPEPTQAEVAPPPPPPPQHKPARTKKTSSANKAKSSAAKSAAAAAATAATAATATDGASKVAIPGAAPATAPAPAQQAASMEPSGVSPIGQLSSGEGAAGSQKRHETSDLIATTEQRLNGIKRTLSSQEQETAAQIRTYLKQAKQALTVDDLDGASTLATKAKVLLEELTKS